MRAFDASAQVRLRVLYRRY